MSHTLSSYGAAAPWYEWDTAVFQGYRRRIIDALPLRPGDTVLDVGCGSGLCLSRLRSRVGRGGEVVGIDCAPDMLQIARARVVENGWHNVDLVEAPVDAAVLPRADAALFCAVHDVLQSSAALHNVCAHLRPGAWVVAGGGKFPDSWPSPLNIAVALLHGPYVRSLQGFDRPWAKLARHLDHLRVEEDPLGTFFVAIGRIRGAPGAGVR